MESQQPITKDMILGDIAKKYPETIEVLLSYGLHCVGCGAAGMETLEQGCAMHGMPKEQFEKLLEDLNKGVTLTKETKKEKPKTEAQLEITETAVEKVKEIMKKENKNDHALRIAVVPGGCAGMSYQFMFDDKKEKDDVVIEKSGLKIVLSQETAQMMDGSTIDFIEGIQGSGFKVDNPNAKEGYGCGKSGA